MTSIRKKKFVYDIFLYLCHQIFEKAKRKFKFETHLMDEKKCVISAKEQVFYQKNNAVECFSML